VEVHVATRPAVREPLSRDRVIAAALAVADAEDVEAVTMRRLAEALQVHPTSMYNHVPTKDAILDGIAEALVAEAALPDHFPTWQDWVRAMAAGLRAVARAHPGAFLVLTQRAAGGPAAGAVTEAALDAFRRGGFSPGRAAEAVSGVSLALLGVALNECPPTAPLADAHLTRLPLSEYPRISEAITADVSEDGVWHLVVEGLIAGITPSDPAS
jgi:AcrR family transcriptional regulator